MKPFLFPLTLLFLGVATMVAYRIIGVEVAADGTLVEAFALIPLGHLLILAGSLLGVVALIRRVLRK